MRGSGTLLYASPEQMRGDAPDPRDDVHALGVIWYQMVTGDMTRTRPGGSGWRRRFLDRGMPVAMLDLLESCFEDQEDRPADASVLAEGLREILKRPSQVTEGEVVESPAQPTVAPSPAAVKKQVSKPSGGRKKNGLPLLFSQPGMSALSL